MMNNMTKNINCYHNITIHIILELNSNYDNFVFYTFLITNKFVIFPFITMFCYKSQFFFTLKNCWLAKSIFFKLFRSTCVFFFTINAQKVTQLSKIILTTYKLLINLYIDTPHLLSLINFKIPIRNIRSSVTFQFSYSPLF